MLPVDEPKKSALPWQRHTWIVPAGASFSLLLIGWFGIAHVESLAGSGGTLLKKQILWSFLAWAAAIVAARLPEKWLRDNALTAYFLSLGMLLCVFAFEPVGGAHRWIRLGPIGFQPSQLAKLATILALAHLMTDRRHPGKGRNLLLYGLLTATPAVLIALEPDLGTALLFFPVLVAMMLAAPRLPLSRLAVVLGLGLLSLPFVWNGLSAEQRSRVTSLFNQPRPGEEISPDAWQLFHAKKLLLRGTGRAFSPLPRPASSEGLPELSPAERHLPGGANDFIFCMLVHRFGAIAVLVIPGLFALLLGSGFSIAQKALPPFRQVLAMGLTTMIGLEAVIHLAVNVGILPVTGISLPLVSYGGSGLLTTAMAIGMLIRIDRVDARSDRMVTLPDQLFS